MIEIGTDQKIILEKLDKDEATGFAALLKEEVDRHKREIDIADLKMMRANTAIQDAFWHTAIQRHQQDIRETVTLIAKARGMFDL